MYHGSFAEAAPFGQVGGVFTLMFQVSTVRSFVRVRRTMRLVSCQLGDPEMYFWIGAMSSLNSIKDQVHWNELRNITWNVLLWMGWFVNPKHLGTHTIEKHSLEILGTNFWGLAQHDAASSLELTPRHMGEDICWVVPLPSTVTTRISISSVKDTYLHLPLLWEERTTQDICEWTDGNSGWYVEMEFRWQAARCDYRRGWEINESRSVLEHNVCVLSLSYKHI